MDEIYIRAESLGKYVVRHFRIQKDLYTLDEIIGLMQDMDDDICNLKDKIEQLERDIEVNYKPRKKYE